MNTEPTGPKIECLDTIERRLSDIQRKKELAIAQVHAVESEARSLFALLHEPQCHLPGCACNSVGVRGEAL